MDKLIETENDIIVGGVINIDNKYINWEYFDKNREKLLHLIDTETFLNL